MQISEILAPERIEFDNDCTSKKAALETIASLLAQDCPQLTQLEVFDSLVTRERLGSTGLGHGVAIPHGRTESQDITLGAFIRMRTPIDFDAVDRQPVDILFALLVPRESTDEHLQILSRLAEKFSDQGLLEKLRSENSKSAVFELLVS